MDKDSWPKRYFWRRVAAFTVDFVLAYAVAVVILMAVDAATGGYFYYWKGLYSQTACLTAPPSPLLNELNKIVPALPDEQRTEFVCRTLPAGGKARYMLTVKSETSEGQITRFQYASAEVTASGDRLDTDLKLDPTIFAAYLLMLGWARCCGRSPGKRWLRLAVIDREAESITSLHLLRRELFRLGPLLIFSLIDVAVALAEWWLIGSISDYVRFMGLFLSAPIAWTAPYAVLSLALVVYYLFPFLRWRGQAFYDRLAGAVVVRG